MLDFLSLHGVDIGVLIVLLLGSLLGLILGFIRSGLFIASWVGAGVSTIFGFPLAQPYFRQLIEDIFFADIAAGITIFLVALVILFLLSSFIGSWVRNSRLNALDRSLGMLSGLATSIVLLAGLQLIMENIWPGNNIPTIIQKSKSRPVIRGGAKLLNEMLPKSLKVFSIDVMDDAADKTKKAIEKRIYERLVQPERQNLGDEERSGYDTKERKTLERAIDSLNHSSQ